MIQVNQLSKTFLVPHENKAKMKDYFVNIFSKTRYEVFQALDKITFSVTDGEWLGIIGKNGSGKSTLLKILANIYSPDSGKIKTSANIASFLQLGAGFELELPARDNIYLNGILLGIPRQTIKEKFDEIVHFAEVEKFIDMKLNNFSSGMKMRLAFAIAMHAQADIFLIDEIFSVGDYAFQQKSMEAFKNKFKEKTIILVSHNFNHIKNHCHKALWLDKGKVKAIGKPQETINQYIQREKTS